MDCDEADPRAIEDFESDSDDDLATGPENNVVPSPGNDVGYVEENGCRWNGEDE